MTTRFADHLLTGTHAGRPAATAVPTGTLYASTDHTIVYQSDGAVWSDWHDGSGAGGSGALTQISQTVLASAAATISFTSIAATWEELLLVLHGRSSTAAAAAAVNMIFNSDTGTNYAHQRFFGSAAAAGSAETTGAAAIRIGGIPAASATAGNAGIIRVEIPGYARTVFDKACFARALYPNMNIPVMVVEANGGHWDNTAAITRIDLTTTANFIIGTVATLYGRG